MPDYRNKDVKAPSRLGALSGFLNLKRNFDDAVRQQEWKNEHDTRQARISEAGKLATSSNMTGDQLNQFQQTGQYPSDFQGGEGQDRNIVLIDPVTGEKTSSVSIGRYDKAYKGMMSSEQMKERGQVQGEVKANQQDIQTTQKLSNAVKRLGIINKQFKDAFPSGDRTPLEQRIVGGAANFGVKTGLYNNPKLKALQQNIRPIAINMIRMFGEVGNLSESEQQGAIDVVSQSKLTDSERLASTRQFIEYALAGASPAGITYIKNNRKDIQGVLDSFGVDLDSLGEDKGNSFGGNNFASEQEAEAANLPPGTIVTINGKRARID